MKNPWETHDPRWLVGLVRTQHPAETQVADALRDCRRWRRDTESYFYFIGLNETGVDGERVEVARCLELASEDEGRVVLDLLADGRVLGIEFLEFRGEHVRRGLVPPSPAAISADRAPKIRDKPPQGDVACAGILDDTGAGDRDLLCGQCRKKVLQLERDPGPVDRVEMWVKCRACRAWNSFLQPDYKQPTGKYTSSVPSDWTYSHNKPNFRGRRSSRSSRRGN